MTTPYVYKRKAFRVGGSRALTIPDLWLKAMDCDDGTEYTITCYVDKVVITIEEE